MAARNLIGRSSWAIRRRIIIGTLVWCGCMVTYLAVFGRAVSLSETIANGCLLLMASVIGSYVFGAVWDDKGQMVSPGTTEVYQKTVTQPDIPTGPAMPPPPGDQ